MIGVSQYHCHPKSIMEWHCDPLSQGCCNPQSIVGWHCDPSLLNVPMGCLNVSVTHSSAQGHTLTPSLPSDPMAHPVFLTLSHSGVPVELSHCSCPSQVLLSLSLSNPIALSSCPCVPGVPIELSWCSCHCDIPVSLSLPNLHTPVTPWYPH